MISDLKDSLQQRFIGEDDQDIWQQIFTQHPLQAFSQRYYDQKDHKLFSYLAANCPPIEKEDKIEQWFKEDLIKADESSRQLSLTQLIQFFNHPARYCLQQRLGLRFEFDEQKLDSREPFSLNALQSWLLRQQLLEYRLHGRDNIEEFIKATAVLPQGNMGEQLYNNQCHKVEQFTDTLLTPYPEKTLDPIIFELAIGAFSITGQLSDLSVEGLFTYRMGKASGRQVINSWIKHLLLNCIKPESVKCESRLFTEDKKYLFEEVSKAKHILNILLELYWQGLQQPLPFFAKTSFVYAQAVLNGGRSNPETAIFNAWNGNQMIAGERDDLIYQQLYSSSPLDKDFEQLALTIYQPLHAHLQGLKL